MSISLSLNFLSASTEFFKFSFALLISSISAGGTVSKSLTVLYLAIMLSLESIGIPLMSGTSVSRQYQPPNILFSGGFTSGTRFPAPVMLCPFGIIIILVFELSSLNVPSPASNVTVMFSVLLDSACTANNDCPTPTKTINATKKSESIF